MKFGKLNLFVDNLLEVENTFAVHWPSTDGFKICWFYPQAVPWWSTDGARTIHWPSLTISRPSVDHSFLWRVRVWSSPLSSTSGTWMVHWWCPDSYGHPVMISGLLEQSTGIHRKISISGARPQDNDLYSYINSCTLYHPHSLHRCLFMEISTWMTWTMFCFKCRKKMYDMHHELNILRFFNALWEMNNASSWIK